MTSSAFGEKSQVMQLSASDEVRIRTQAKATEVGGQITTPVPHTYGLRRFHSSIVSASTRLVVNL